MYLSGKRLVSLMRKHKVTIRGLAARMDITIKAVREARERGADMPGRLDLEEAVEGEFTPRHRAMLKQWRLANPDR
jgi:hypothetical protein